MEIPTMGKVTTHATMESVEDLFEVAKGNLAAEQVRRVDVDNALVDTGATMLSLPSRLIKQLGLRPQRKRIARTPAGLKEFLIHDIVQLTIQGRECKVEVAELPDDCPVLIGQVPLEILDFVVDPVGQQLIGNPDHNGEQMIDLF
jgi:predicted aspartyl protease